VVKLEGRWCGMAERRMFAKSVIGSARFLRMPSTSRLLYYDLGMQADDDGVVEAFAVMRTTGATEDDLRVLASKGFITVLNDDLVTYITDWSRNNLIKRDRYRPSIYKDLLVRINDGTQMEPDWNQYGTRAEPEVKVIKDSESKGSKEDTTVSSCAEPETVSTPPVITLPLNDGNEYPISQELCQEWINLYPAVDVHQQLRNMRGWLLSNAERRKTRRGIKRFITGWLSREQDRGSNRAGCGAGNSNGRSKAVPSDDDYLKGWGDAL